LSVRALARDVSTDHVGTFEESLSGLADSCRRVSPEGFADALAAVAAAPAVGVPLPFAEVSLEETPVATEFDATDLRAAETGVTPAGLGIADYGTVTLRSTAAGDELVALYPYRHVAVVHADDVCPDMTAAFERLGEEFAAGQRTQVFATGPSATADMGGLIRGVHGPKEVHVVVVEP
jgi:L-lactate dehydrogenase complex protein LldG